MRGLSILALPALFTSACAHKPVFDTYRLRGPLLVTPGVAAPDITRRVFTSDVTPGTGSCAGEAPMLQRRKKHIVVTVDSGALRQHRQPGWLSDWAMQAEAHGCIAQGESLHLATQIAESVPLEPMAEFRLLHANDIQSGYVELGPENRLEVRSTFDTAAIQTAGVTGSGNQLTVDVKAPTGFGFEIGWFGLEPNTGRAGFHFVPLTADRTARNGTVHLDKPSTDYFQFAPDAAFFRLFYKTDNNGVTAIVIAGATRPDLDRRTKAVGADASACEQSKGLCIVLPKRVGVNPFLVVSANGKELTVPLGGTVRSAIQAAGARPDAVLPTLAVTREYAGRLRPVEFDRPAGEILNLKLNGGEQLTW